MLTITNSFAKLHVALDVILAVSVEPRLDESALCEFIGSFCHGMDSNVVVGEDCTRHELIERAVSALYDLASAAAAVDDAFPIMCEDVATYVVERFCIENENLHCLPDADL